MIAAVGQDTGPLQRGRQGMREQLGVPAGDQAAFGAAGVLLKAHSTYVQLADRLPGTGAVGWPGERTEEETPAHHLLPSPPPMSGKASNLDWFT